MDQKNLTMVTFFIVKGISDIREIQAPIFILVLLIYLAILGSNMTILLLVCLDRQLHTPMYFFLGNLSVIDMSSATVTLHLTMYKFLTGDNKVSFFGCMTQLFVFILLSTSDLLILTAMSYDRYVAICNPLHYTMTMRQSICAVLAIACWLVALTIVTPYLILLLDISCYISNKINHFFCDIAPVMRLSCSDTSVLEILIFTEGLFISVLTPFLLTFISYVFIISSILKIRSSTGRRKTFHTCSSHLTVVVLLYVTLVCQYMRPISMDSLESNKIFSLFNTAAVPALNPLIYSLKNKDVKSALRRQLRSFKLIL